MVNNLNPESLPQQAFPTHELTPSPNLITEMNSPETEHIPGWFKRIAKAVTDAWFDPKSFEQHPGFYEILGVRTFKKYMPTSGDLIYQLAWKKLGANDQAEINIENLKRIENATKIFEAVHTTAFGVFSSLLGIALTQNNIKAAAFITGLNTLINIYPIMVQRYNRVRLQKTILKMEERNARISAAEETSTS